MPQEFLRVYHKSKRSQQNTKNINRLIDTAISVAPNSDPEGMPLGEFEVGIGIVAAL